MFHGSFTKKEDAKAKEKKVKGSWIKGTLTNAGYRYLVLSERKNPIKQHRGRNVSRVDFDPAIGKYLATAFSKQYGNVYAHGYTKKQAATNLRDRLRALRRGDIDPHTWQESGAGYYAGNPENPGPNPHELMVMGANPGAASRSHEREITLPPGATVVIRTPRQNPSSTAGLGGYGITTVDRLLREKKPREALRYIVDQTGVPVHEAWNYVTRRMKELKIRFTGPRPNPSAEAIRESFTGAPVDGEMITDEPHMPAGSYAQLGEVLALHVKPHSGGQIQAIEFSRPRPLLVSDESARQIYFVGGDQNLDDSLMAFNPRHRGRGIYELGQGRRIDYKQRKAHVRNPDADEWRHDLGEETGERPLVLYDTNCRRILLEGGAYVIRPEGIVN
jgi:hypothetical protein